MKKSGTKVVFNIANKSPQGSRLRLLSRKVAPTSVESNTSSVPVTKAY
jgi:hypothetical protein